MIPFNRQFADDERDSNLPDKLWEERGDIGWLVEGAVAYHKALAEVAQLVLVPARP